MHAIIFRVDKGLYEGSHEALREFPSDQPFYHLAESNCKTFAADVMSRLGVGVDPKTGPFPGAVFGCGIREDRFE